MKSSGRALKTLPQIVTGIDTKTNDTKTFSEFVMGRLFSLRFKSWSSWDLLGHQSASPKIVCQESKIFGFYRLAFFIVADFMLK